MSSTSESELRTPSSTRWDSSHLSSHPRPPLSASSSYHLPPSARPPLRTISSTPADTSGQDSNSESSSSVKKRRRTTPEELKILEDAYLANNLPSSEERAALAERTGMGVRGVQIWFQNKRQTEKRKMQQVNHYPNVMIIPLPHPGHPAANLHPSDPRFVAAAQAGYAAYVPSVLHPSPSHMFASASQSGGSERSALSPVDPNAKVQQGQAGKHEFRYPPTTYSFPPPRFAYSNSHGRPYGNSGQFAISPMYAASLPGMGHVYAAQAAYQVKMAKNAGQERRVYESSSERTRRDVESSGSSPRGEGYSSDSGAVDASSPIKKEAGGGDLLEFTDRRASEGYRARISSEGELRATRADSTTSLPTPLPSLRALSELKTSRPTLARTQSATMTIRELAGLPSRPRSSLGFATPNVGVSRGILDEMCTRRELPFPHPPSSPVGERDDMMITPARGDSTSGSRTSDPPSLTRSADVADDSSSIMATDESDAEDTDAPNVRGGSRRLNSFSARSNATDEDEDRPTLRRLASLDYYAGTPARRSVSVGLGAVRMGAKKPTFGRKLLEGKRSASVMDDENDDDEEVPLRKIKRSRREESTKPTTTAAIEEKAVAGARDEEAARLLLGLGMFGSV